MPFGSPVANENGSVFSISFHHTTEDTVQIAAVQITLGDSGATLTEAKTVVQDLIDLLDGSGTFTFDSASQIFPSEVAVTPTP